MRQGFLFYSKFVFDFQFRQIFLFQCRHCILSSKVIPTDTKPSSFILFSGASLKSMRGNSGCPDSFVPWNLLDNSAHAHQVAMWVSTGSRTNQARTHATQRMNCGSEKLWRNFKFLSWPHYYHFYNKTYIDLVVRWQRLLVSLDWNLWFTRNCMETIRAQEKILPAPTMIYPRKLAHGLFCNGVLIRSIFLEFACPIFFKDVSLVLGGSPNVHETRQSTSRM